MVQFFRLVIIWAVLVGLAVAGLFAYRQLTSGLPVVLPAPRHLHISPVGSDLLPGGWTNSPAITLSARAASNVIAGIDVEVRPAGETFSDAATASDNAAQATCPNNDQCGQARRTDPAITVHLADGSYRWQLRLHNGRGVSPWVPYRGVLRVDTHPPRPPKISSPTDPNPARVYHSANMTFTWQSTDTGSGIAGYSYRLDTNPHGAAKTEIRIPTDSVRLVGLDTGRYYFHVRARDNAGNWSASTTFPVQIDVTPPGLAHVRFSEFTFDPQFNPLRVSFAVTRPATTVRLGVYRQSDNQLVRLYRLGHLARGKTAVVWWDGKNAQGQPVGSGAYEIYIRAIDRYGHSSVTGWRDLLVNYKRIVVSLSQQRLVAYDGNRVVVTSLVTTGNRLLPTPVGTFQILAKFHPFTFHSPWPKSSPYWYPPSLTQYAMMFQQGGYYIHDAPWRSVFGPGSNAQLGTPGNNYTGTHGCINVPANVAQELFAWAPIGTVVQVVK